MATFPQIDRDSRRLRKSGAPSVFIFLSILLVLCIGAIGFVASRYNRLVELDQAVQGQWAQVENGYQRRADLVPNLVKTVKGAADFEKQTLTAVIDARARATASTPRQAPTNPEELERYQSQQDQLGGALSRLMVVVEAYPQLRATEAFRDLQAQLEGTENRISVERMRFNDAARTFNTSRNSFPTNFVAGTFGERFAEKAFFRARQGTDRPPEVEFDDKAS